MFVQDNHVINMIMFVKPGCRLTATGHAREWRAALELYLVEKVSYADMKAMTNTLLSDIREVVKTRPNVLMTWTTRLTKP